MGYCFAGFTAGDAMEASVSRAESQPIVARTIPQIFAARVGRSPDSIAYTQFDRRKGVWVNTTWRQAAVLVERWRDAFAGSGLTAGDRVALLLDNGLNWICFDQAALSLGLVSVPLFSSDSPENWTYVLRDSAPVLLLIGKLDDWQRLQPLRTEFPSVRTVVCAADDVGAEAGLLTLPDWLSRGVAAPQIDVTSETLATITYSSGTTGRPKGVMLTHGNLASAARAVLARHPGYDTDVFLSFLPTAHVFARTVEYYAAMICGGRIAFARSIAELPEDFVVIRPTVMMGVPRIYERAWNSIQSASKASAVGAWLLKAAVRLYPMRDKSIAHRIASRIATSILKKRVLARFGGRVRLAVSGSAPLSSELALGLRAVGMPLVEGYGMAEAAGPVSGDFVSDYQPGTVGRLLDGVEARLSEGGELLIRSPSIMSGYWGRAEETKQAIDQDGWLHTGDLAEWVGDRIRIVGRVHDVIVTATGEKLAPAELELRITNDPLFEQAIVVGNNRPCVMALVVLNKAGWADLATVHGINPADPNARDAETLLLERIGSATKGLPRYCQVRRLHATLEPWTPEAGLATVTMKLKRAKVEDHYRDVIEKRFAGQRSLQPTPA